MSHPSPWLSVKTVQPGTNIRIPSYVSMRNGPGRITDSIKKCIESSPESPISSGTDKIVYAEVHNALTPPLHKKPAMNEVLQGWQKSLPKLYKYPPEQLQVIFHRSGNSSDANIQVQTPSPKKTVPISTAAKSKTGLIPVKKRTKTNDEKRTTKIKLVNHNTEYPRQIYTPPSVDQEKPNLIDVVEKDANYFMNNQTFVRPVDKENSLFDPFHLDDTDQEKAEEIFPDQVERKNIDGVDCFRCEILKEEMMKLEKDLKFANNQSRNANKLCEILVKENQKLKNENCRLTDLLKRFKEGADESVEIVKQFTCIKDFLVNSPFSSPTDGLYSQESIDNSLAMGKISPQGESTPIDRKVMAAVLCSARKPPLVDFPKLETPVERIQKHIGLFHGQVSAINSGLSVFRNLTRTPATPVISSSYRRTPIPLYQETPKSSHPRVLNETFTQGK